MLKLFPGLDSDPIRISLVHRPLSSLPECEALSYEWGSPTGNHEIVCKGKTLMVTTNLLAALKRLWPRKSVLLSSEPRVLWIDALCINQEDIDERFDQVKLMADIYRNAKRTLIWIGEAPPLAKEAMSMISELAKLWKVIPGVQSWDNRPSLDGDSETWEQLREKPV